MLPDLDYLTLDPTLLEPILAYWFEQAKPERIIGSTENLVWRCQNLQTNSPFVLRLVHHSHRNQAAVEAELAWLEQLAAADLPVCSPFKTLHNTLLVPCELFGERFYASAFNWLEGERLASEADWPMELVVNLGKLTARLHLQGRALSAEQLASRPFWDNHTLQGQTIDLAPFKTEHNWLNPIYASCLESLQKLPQTPEHYGLIHADLHNGNFLIQDQQIQVFDFDDCLQGWYAQDLAWIVYSALYSRTQSPEPFAAWFSECLKRGYQTVRTWPELFSEQLELFFQWRDLQLLLFFNQRWPKQKPLKIQADSKKLATRLKAGKTLLDPV